jgi:hypothetical protein
MTVPIEATENEFQRFTLFRYDRVLCAFGSLYEHAD